MSGNVHGGKQLGADKKQIVVFVPRDIHDKIVEAAVAKRKTISDLVRELLYDFVEKESS